MCATHPALGCFRCRRLWIQKAVASGLPSPRSTFPCAAPETELALPWDLSGLSAWLGACEATSTGEQGGFLSGNPAGKCAVRRDAARSLPAAWAVRQKEYHVTCGDAHLAVNSQKVACSHLHTTTLELPAKVSLFYLHAWLYMCLQVGCYNLACWHGNV